VSEQLLSETPAKFLWKITDYKMTKTLSNKGFTLVEMIVSLGIFAVVAVVALGALVRIITANQKAQTLEAAVTNMNYSLESMSRELRVSTEYQCYNDRAFANDLIHLNGTTNASDLSPIQGCPINDIATGDQNKVTVIAFKSSQRNRSNTCNLIYAYRFKNVPVNSGASGMITNIHLQKAAQKNTTLDCQNPIVDTDFQDVLASDNLIISDYRFGVYGIDASAPYPFAFIRLTGYAGTSEKQKTYFDVQTTVSSRVPQSN